MRYFAFGNSCEQYDKFMVKTGVFFIFRVFFLKKCKFWQIGR
jgi:hypothetical protein